MDNDPAASERAGEAPVDAARDRLPDSEAFDGAVGDADNRVLIAWLLIVVTAGITALLFDYDRIWLGAVVLYTTFVVDLIKAYPETKASTRNEETLIAVGVTVIVLYLHTAIVWVVDGIAVEVGAAQIVALAAFASRGYAVLRHEGSIEVVFEDPDPVTHPFITVGATVTFLLGALVLTSWSALGAFGSGVTDPGSATGFFVIVALGASAGLAAHLLSVASAGEDR